MNIKWKGLDLFVDWCKANPNEGKTIEEIAVEFLGLDLAKLKSSTVRRFFREKIGARVSALKKRVDKSNSIPFISVKKIKRNGVEVSGYGSLLPEGSDLLYVHKTNVIVEGILKNRNKLVDCKQRLVQTVAMVEKKKKKQKVGDTDAK